MLDKKELIKTLTEIIESHENVESFDAELGFYNKKDRYQIEKIIIS